MKQHVDDSNNTNTEKGSMLQSGMQITSLSHFLSNHMVT